MGRTQIYWLTRGKNVYYKKWTWMMTIISMAFSDDIRVHLFRKIVYYKQKDTNRSNNFNWIFCYYSYPIQKKICLWVKKRGANVSIHCTIAKKHSISYSITPRRLFIGIGLIAILVSAITIPLTLNKNDVKDIRMVMLSFT